MFLNFRKADSEDEVTIAVTAIAWFEDAADEHTVRLGTVDGAVHALRGTRAGMLQGIANAMQQAQVRRSLVS